MGKNTIKICSDAYRKHIDYFWMEEDGEWKNMNQMDNFSLNKDRFVSSSILQNAYDVLGDLKKHYATKGGLKIIFEGTDDECEHLSFIRKAYYTDCDMELEQGSRKMKSAKEVMPQIEHSFENLEEYFEKHSDEGMNELLAKYRETVKQEVNLCVMGVYSSGKSTFINSLIGREILPSDSDAATAKIYKIRASEEYKVAFMFSDENYEIKFDDTGWKANNKNPDSEIMRRIKGMIDNKKPKTKEQFVYWVLFALNEYAKEEGKERHEELLECYERFFAPTESESDEEEDDEEEDDEEKNEDKKIEKLLEKYRVKKLTENGDLTENKLGDVIEVFVEFRNSYLPLDKAHFVIYDTPGSNSVMFREHMDILKDSLEQQTNGLPIFVTTPDNMDSTDNRKIINVIKKMGKTLDLSNMMVVVNRSDDKAKSDLKQKAEKKEELAVTKKAKEIYFVSSIMGLGGKKENPTNKDEWISENYAECFKKNTEYFSNPDCEGYRRLFEYNILPEDVRKRLEKKVECIQDTERLLWNSGIPCVEEEIGIFAEKYALYNKCANAINYLGQAARMLDDKITEARKNAEDIRKNIERQRDEQTTKLIEELEEICENKKQRFTSQFADDVMKDYISKYLDETRIKDVVNSVDKSSLGKNDFERLAVFNGNLNHKLKTDMRNYSEETSQKIIDYWANCAGELGTALMKKVVDSPYLSAEQKELVRTELLKVTKVPDTHKFFNIANTGAVKNIGKKFLWINRTRIDLGKTIDEYTKSLHSDISAGNMHVTGENERQFDQWISRILNILEAKLSEFNPDLKEMSGKLEGQQHIIDTKQKQLDVIKKETDQINGLLEFEEVQE